MYIPAVRSIPLLEKKGEFVGEAGASTNSIYANGSYAINNDIAISINGNLSYRNFSNKYDLLTDISDPPYSSNFMGVGRGNTDITDLYQGQFAHRYGEVSVGKINLLSHRRLALEIFGGAGTGRATDVAYFENNDEYQCDYYSLFGQGNYGFKNKIIETGVSLRLAYSKFDYTANLKNVSEPDDGLFQHKFGAISFEPMGFTRIGNNKLKFVVRYGINLAYTLSPVEKHTGKYRGFDTDGRLANTILHFSIGVSYKIESKKD
jgi:hypothetical protein